MNVASFGSVVFTVNAAFVRTLAEFTLKGSARWAVHEIIGNVCKPDFVGPGQGEISFSLILLSELGTSPRIAADELMSMMTMGIVAPFIIGGRPVGGGMWYIEEIEQSEFIVNARGKVRKIVLNVTLKEYY